MLRSPAAKKFVALSGVAAIAAALLVPSAGAGIKRWTRHGPHGGWGFALAVHPDNAHVVLAGSNGGGLYRTKDGGKHWTIVSGVPGTADVSDIAFSTKNPSIAYVAADNFDLFKSTDSGKSWKVTGRGNSLSVAIHPTSPQIVYSGSYSGGLMKSTNGGKDWVDKNAGINGDVNVVLIDPEDTSTVWAGTDDSVYRNGAAGEGTWTQRATGIPVSAQVEDLAIDHENHNTLWVALDHDELYRTDDDGAQWDKVNAYTAPSARFVEVDPTNSARVYVGDGSHLYLITNDGANVVQRDFDFYSPGSVQVAPSNSQIVYAIDAASIYRSTDRGQHFVRRDKGYTATNVYDLDLGGGALYAATGEKGVVRSTDGGNTWAGRNNGLVGPVIGAIAVAPSRPRTVYVGSGGSADALFRSEDGGGSWELADDGMVDGATQLRNVSALEVHPTDPNVVYAGANQGSMSIFKTTDGGDNWTEKPTGLSVALTEVNDIKINLDSPNIVYAATDVGLYKSTTSGDAWGVVGPPGNPPVRGVAVDPSDPQNIYAATNDGIWKSDDAGASWDVLPKGLDNYSLRSVIVDPANPSHVYVGGLHVPDDIGVLRSTNGGQDWERVRRGWSGAVVDTLVLDRSKGRVLHAATWARGVESYLFHPFVKRFPRFSKSRTIGLGWNGPAGHSIKHYDVDVRKGAYNKELGARTIVVNNARAGGRRLDGKPGFTYCYRARANDAKRSSDFSNERCAAIPVDDRSFVQHGNADWAEKTGNGYFLNTYLEGMKQGKSLSLIGLKGTDFGLMVSKCAGCGTIQVTFNPGFGASVGNYDLSGSNRKKVFINLADFSTPVTASVTVEITSAGKPVRIDGVGVRKEVASN